MTEHFQLPGDQPLKRTYDPKTKTLHVEQVRTASVKAGSDKTTQEEWDAIFIKEDMNDTQRLDWLQTQLEKNSYTGKCIFRWSTRGRGWRLHETSIEEAVPSVRDAIDSAAGAS